MDGPSSWDIINDLSNTPIHFEKDPLCRICLVPVADESPCTVSGIKSDLPHQYDLLYCLHHSFTDGYTTAITAHAIINLINDVIAGRPIDDNKPLGIFVSDEDIRQRKKTLVEQLEKRSC